MKVHRASTVALILTAAAAASSCSDTSQQQTTVRSSPAASPTSGATDVTKRVSDEAGKLADKAKEEGKEVAAAVMTEKQAIDVRAALMADKTIDASRKTGLSLRDYTDRYVAAFTEDAAAAPEWFCNHRRGAAQPLNDQSAD